MPFESPLSTFIHLTSGFHERRQTLLGLKATKLQMAERFLRRHSQQLNLLQPHVTESHFENAQGDYFATQFEGARRASRRCSMRRCTRRPTSRSPCPRS